MVKIGNNTIPQFLYEPSFTNNYLYYSYDGQNTQRGFWYSNVANATIKWEDVAQWNIGVDASFLDNRLNTTIEYYDKKNFRYVIFSRCATFCRTFFGTI